MSNEKVNLMLVRGVEGPSVYLNDYRILGNKPWGGGETILITEDCIKELKKALGGTGYKIVESNP